MTGAARRASSARYRSAAEQSGSILTPSSPTSVPGVPAGLPDGRPGCPPGPPGARFCAGCGQPYWLTLVQAEHWQYQKIGKASAARAAGSAAFEASLQAHRASERARLMRKTHGSYRSDVREALWAQVEELDRLGGPS
jgi:hypothetical protein